MRTIGEYTRSLVAGIHTGSFGSQTLIIRIMFYPRSFSYKSLGLLLLGSILSSADQVVYLERLGLPNGDGIINEPLFNPKSINASIGEKIHFVTRFSDVSNVPVSLGSRLSLTE